ncbi:MAG: hypothetical protein AAFN59_11505 [Pseudomonadota bacterium]
MTRKTKLWLGLAVVYVLFLAWHQPLRGPLTQDEVRSAFGPQFERMLESENRQARAFLDFFMDDDGKPFFMVNLNALPEATPEVEDAAQSYGRFMAPRLLSRASYPMLSADVIVPLTNSLGVDLDAFERLVVVRYRSRRDFLEIVATKEFQRALEDKTGSLEGWYSAPSAIGLKFSFPVAALWLLIAIGLISTNWPSIRRRKQRASWP